MSHWSSDIGAEDTSLVPRPSSPPAFGRLQYAKTEHTASDQELEVRKAWERG